MTLDLYYCNFSSVGSGLERFYQGFLIEENNTTAGVKHKSKNWQTENEKLQKNFEKLSVSRSKPPNLKLQIKKSEGGEALATTPLIRSDSTPNYKNPKRDFSAPPSRPVNSRQKNATKSPQKTIQQNLDVRSPKAASRSVSASPQYRSYSVSKKPSPQEIGSKKSHPPNGRGEKPANRAINRPVTDIRSSSPVKVNKTNDENVLRPQNSPSSSMQTTSKQKVNSKVYFREENIENLTWNGESVDGEDPEASTSPKVNPYSSSFLSFLSSN